MSIYSDKFTGFIELRKRFKGHAISCVSGETPWFFSAGREFGLWHLTAHGFGLYFNIIGPFRYKRVAV